MWKPNLESEARSVVSSSVSQARSRLLGKSSIRTTILYILCVIVVFVLLGFIGHFLIQLGILPPESNVGFLNYLIITLFVFLLGMLHVSSMRSFMTWIKPQDYMQGTLMTLLMGIIGAIAIFVLSFSYKASETLMNQEFKANVRPLISTLLIFPLAYFIQWAAEAYEQIPPKIYKLWRYKPLLQMPQLLEHEYKQTTIVLFVIDIRFGEKNHYDMRSRIPNRLTVGDGFQFSIDEENQNNSGREIEIRSPQGEYYQWYFYIKKPWWKPDLFIDPDRTILENHLRDGNRIVARRHVARKN